MINKSRDNIAYTLLDVNKEISRDLLIQMMKIEGIIKARNIPLVVEEASA